jgi:hypothetical protein
MDTLREEAIIDVNKLGTKYVQPNSKEVVITQPISIGIITNEQVDVVDQYAKYGSLSTFGFYGEEIEVVMELVHALTNKTRDVKWSYGKRIQ